jgi:type II restriction/modification system DNA methylase subunit YeeA
METAKLKKFAQFARRSLMEQIAAKLKQVLADNSPARRENTKAISQLEKAVREHGKEQVIERVAYTWFNRFCALRFMDVNRYTRIGIVSPAEGQFQPEILAEAKMGHIDENMVNDKIRQQVFALLDGKSPSHDPQGEAYRLLLVAACNSWHRAMSFLFEEINDYTELLMPDDLLSGNSILAHTREAMTPDVCEGVEVIGWLYQFYISEKKDAVFTGLKKNKKITPENIPAATQLFTPHWIVRYLVENSLGRLWMLDRPHSRLIEKMDYYIKPEQPETDFLHINKPEEIKFCDPACGSGHILAYAFDLFYAMYEEEGYEPAEIPAKILNHNLYGIEIDERAGALAAFALTMKARTRHRRFFRKPVTPNICVLKNVQFDEKEINEYMDFIDRDLFTAPLQTTLRQFEEADNFGSLIRPEITDVAGLLKILESKNIEEHMFLSQTHQKVLQVLWQADYLSPKYHVVVANPPYMGGKGMNGRLGTWLKDNYADVKSDLFSAFIVRNTELALPKGQLGFMSPFVWMFISSYEKLRSFLINQKTITSLVQLEYSGFDGATVPICTFTVENIHHPEFRGGFVRLSNFRGATNQAPRTLEAIKDNDCGWFYRSSGSDFNKIPGSPIVYWASERILDLFQNSASLSDKIESREGLTTGSNGLFLRLWHEVQLSKIGFGIEDNNEAQRSQKRYFTYIKGGDFRRWSGNFEYIVNWFNDGEELKVFKDLATGRVRAHNYNGDYAFRTGFTWSGISSGTFAVRHVPTGFMFDAKGPMGFARELSDESLHEAFLNSVVTNHLIKMLAPTLDFKIGHILNLPVSGNVSKDICQTSKSAVQLSSCDWNSYETSWDFTSLPVLKPDYRQPILKVTYQNLRAHWQEMTIEMQRLEEENNRIFIEAYGLQDELTPDVPLKEITLTCNPHYRYGGNKSEEELEAQLLADTMRELIFYAVGCMFGRYSLDKPGLILANQGETIEDYLKQIPEPIFTPDEDNVIPLLDADWFSDDITERFKQFLRITFGEEHYEENLTFIEQALNIKGKRSYTLRDYFLSEFYSDHVRRYKKRPIYWLFSSPKGSFNALIYMHRYQPYTASTVLSYLRDFKNEKLRAHKHQLEAVSISASASKSEKAKALKEIEKVNKIITELDAYERDILYPLAIKQVEIDLDDGVKVNYPKFGTALKKIPGLSGDSQ